MVHISKSTILVAALVASPAFSAPVSSEELQFARYLDELDARSTSAGRAAQKLAGNIVDAVGQNKMKEKVKQYTNPPPVVDPRLAEAAKEASGPFSKDAVNQVNKSHKKRYFDDSDFEVRSTSAGRAAQKLAGNIVDAVGQNKIKEKVKQYTNPPPVVDPRLAEAAKKASGPFGKDAVNQVAKGHKKRYFDDSEFETRSTSAGRAAQKSAGNIVDAVGQNKIKEKVKQYTNPPPIVDPRLAEAAKKASRPFREEAVNNVVKGHKKRFFDDSEVESRSTSAGRAAQKLAGNIVDAVGQNKMKEKAKQYTNPPPVVDPRLAEAAKKASGPFSKDAASHVVKNYKRFFDDSEFETRSTNAGRAAQKLAGNIVDAVGQNKIKEKVKQYTNPPAVVDSRLAEAAKKASGPFSKDAVNHVVKSHKKRNFEDMDLYERDYEDFEDVFEREFDDLEERDFDDLEERELFYLNELD